MSYWDKLCETFETDTPIYPLGSCGLAPLDQLFDRTSKLIGEPVEEVIRRVLYERPGLLVVEGKNKTWHEVKTIPGHFWGASEDALFDRGCDLRAKVTGPRPADVLVLGKCPDPEDVVRNRLYTDQTGKVLISALSELRARGFHDWYMTNFVKFAPPNDESALKASWVTASKHLLDQELRLVRPKFILALGTHASKGLFGKDAGVTSLEGKVVDYTYEVAPGKSRKAKVMAVTHPRNAARDKVERRKFVRGIGNFVSLNEDRYTTATEEPDVDHRYVETLDDLRRELEWLEENCRNGFAAIDAEWHGDHPQNAERTNGRSGVLSVQLSVKSKTGLCIELRNDDGTPLMREFANSKPSLKAIKTAYDLIKKFFKGKRPIGHFFVADLEWLVAEGLDLRDEFSVSYLPVEDGFEPWESTARLGGVDTGLALHAIEETGRYGLDEALLRHTTCVPYWLEIKPYLKTKDGEEIAGFGDIPRNKRRKYACLHGDSLVQVESGEWVPIRDLVQVRYSGKVRSLSADGRVIDAQVTNWHRADVGQREWYKLRTETTLGGRWGLLGPGLTPDHEIVTQRGKVRVDAVRIGEDSIATEEREFTPEQLAVFLGCLLGDGGFMRKNGVGVGFGFGQRPDKAEYADWKARVFRTHSPRLLKSATKGHRRYVTPLSRYFAKLSKSYSVKEAKLHQHRKLVVTKNVLDRLGFLGLAVWYQDDGTLADDWSCRIYAKLDVSEQELVVRWLSEKFGEGVSYNENNRFIDFRREAFDRFQRDIRQYAHPSMAYKFVQAPVVELDPPVDGGVFYETIVEVVPFSPTRGGCGVRWCLTVPETGNFLTKSGFVSNCYDADGQFRLFEAIWPLLDSDHEGNSCRQAFWESMIATPAVLEMHQTGVLIDQDRAKELTQLFISARKAQLYNICQSANWPDFNPRSTPQVKEYLFGKALNGSFTSDGRPRKLRPAGAHTLGLVPVLDTAKPQKRWTEIPEEKRINHSPSTNKTSLSLLAMDNEYFSDEILAIRNYRFLDQVPKTVLRPPVRTTTTKKGKEKKEQVEVEFANDWEEEGLVYDGGLLGNMCADGRIRTHFYQTKETSRWSSSRPNLQALSKTRDKDLVGIFKDLGLKYDRKLRSILMAAPGHCLVEADFKGAELYGAAIMAGDAKMIEDCLRNQLPEDDPDYLDIHSMIANLAFGLGLAPTKKALEDAGVEHLRTIAKTVVFGIMYGRSARAVALAAKEQKVKNATTEDAKRVIDTIFELYSGLPSFFDKCRASVVDPGWMRNTWQRLRRFPVAADEKMLADFERQAMNYPIQSLVAGAMSRALAELLHFRKTEGPQDLFRMQLQIHDAVVLEVPHRHVRFVANEVLPYCMKDRVRIYQSDLRGRRLSDKPHRMGIDVGVFEHWSEKLDAHLQTKLGLQALAA